MEIGVVLAIVLMAASAIVLALVAAGETALERASNARIQALAARGDEGAIRIADTEERLEHFLDPLTTARIISVSILLLGFAYLGSHIDGTSGVVWLGAIGAVVVAILQMTVGLLVAKRPEYTAVQLSRVIRITAMGFGILSWLLSLPARLIGRAFGSVAPPPIDDFLALVEREEASGGVEEEERRMIRGIIDLEDKTAREIMVPRIDIAAAEIDSTAADVADLVNERGFSRIPIFRENIDDIVGIVYAKDLLRSVSNGSRERTLGELLRQPVFIPESKRLDQLLTEMRASRTHMAIVVDEYGGTAGLVTIEDLLEEIVGEIEDEYDTAAPPIERISEDEVLLDAGSPTETLQEMFDCDIESEDFDTVGGLVIHELGRLPDVGDEVAVGDLQLSVLSMAGRRIKRVRVQRLQPETVELTAEG
jgi:CBS domain containing-hemolysin-like protein